MNDERRASTALVSHIDVAANDEETALAACEMTVELAQQAIERTLPVESVTLAEPVAIKTGSADRAANWGIDALPGEGSTPHRRRFRHQYENSSSSVSSGRSFPSSALPHSTS
ncbi:MAG: hypothetical protein ACLTQI_07605 [Slackia sp.]